MRQQTLAAHAGFEKYGRKSRREFRRELFLDEMEQVVPWSDLEALVEPHTRRRVTGGVRWVSGSCCGLTSCSSGLTCRTQV